MIVTARHERYASLAHHERGEAMSPRELVEEALRRLTDGSLTFSLQEDQYTVAAMFTLDGRSHAQGWSKALLGDDPETADMGVRNMLSRASKAAKDKPQAAK